MTASRPARTVEDVYGDDYTPAEFEAALGDGSVPVGVYGLGGAGRAEAARFAARTGNAIGVDRDGTVVRALKNGSGPDATRHPGDDGVAEAIRAGSLRVVANPAVVAAHATVHVVVPPAGTAADDCVASRLERTLEAVATGLTRGDLVCVVATVRPETSRSVLDPLLARRSGLDTGDYGFAYAPAWPGRELAREDDDAGERRRIVAGRDPRSRRLAARLYELVGEAVVPVHDVATAERVRMFGALAGLAGERTGPDANADH